MPLTLGFVMNKLSFLVIIYCLKMHSALCSILNTDLDGETSPPRFFVLKRLELFTKATSSDSKAEAHISHLVWDDMDRTTLA